MQAGTLRLRVHAVTWAAPAIHFFDLRPPMGGELPAFAAGANVDVHLGNGLVRQYSLLNDQDERGRYVVGVKRDPRSRGGSAWMHEQLRVGELLEVGIPRNNFPLCEDAPASLLLAGGIGITPMIAMARRLQALGRPWALHYAVRTRGDAVPLAGLDPARVHLHADDEQDGRSLAVEPLLRAAPAGAHLYCCGPAPMIDGFIELAAAFSPEQVHVERFTAAAPAGASRGFHVELSRSGRRVFVEPGATIVESLRREGIGVVTSCEQGICGSCETRVLAGVPEHRDMLLSDEEKASNRAMMICCSGSKEELLVLDL